MDLGLDASVSKHHPYLTSTFTWMGAFNFLIDMESIDLGPDPGPIESKKKSKTLMMVVAIVVVGIIACAAYLLVDETPSDGPTLRTDLRLGDYYEYESVGYDDDGNPISHEIERHEIVSVDNGKYKIQKTEGGEISYYTATAQDFLYHMKIGYETLALGLTIDPAVIDTAWGRISCDDYHYGSNGLETHIYVNDDGVVMDWVGNNYRWTLVATSLF